MNFKMPYHIHFQQLKTIVELLSLLAKEELVLISSQKKQ